MYCSFINAVLCCEDSIIEFSGSEYVPTLECLIRGNLRSIVLPNGLSQLENFLHYLGTKRQKRVMWHHIPLGNMNSPNFSQAL